MTQPSPRLLLLLAVVLGLGAWIVLSGDDQPPPESDPSVPPPPSGHAHPAPAPAGAPVAGDEPLADTLARITADRQRHNVPGSRPMNAFGSKSWYVPPPPKPAKPPPPPMPPPPPSAPPLPYSFVGSYQEGSRLVIFLSRGSNLYTVSPGDVIDGNYRVDGIVSGRLGFTYLPNNIRQTISVGGNT